MSGANRASRVFATQAEAVDYARRLSRRERGDLYIHRSDGTIRSRDSYAKEAFPGGG